MKNKIVDYKEKQKRRRLDGLNIDDGGGGGELG
jgi:hypothetical protein